MSYLPSDEPLPTTSRGAIDLVLEARPRDIGGFLVGRLLPSARRRMVGPFSFLDRARDAWRAQTFPKIPGDDQEFVPLPR